MAAGLYNFTQPATNNIPLYQSSIPQYTQAITQGYQAAMQPQYMQGLQGIQNQFAANGLGSSGGQKLAQLGLQQNYLNQLGQYANQGATQAATMQQQQQFALQQMQQQYQDQQALQNNAISNQNANQWQQMLGQGIGGLLGGVGSLGGMWAAQNLGLQMSPSQMAGLYAGQGQQQQPQQPQIQSLGSPGGGSPLSQNYNYMSYPGSAYGYQG